jgi:CDP-diacylglycerol--serine O-phosphatidyltransferase
MEIGVLISAFYLVMAALRLARFNVQLVGFEKSHFSGLPSPIGAMTVASFVLTFYDSSIHQFVERTGFYFVLISIAIGFLMVSKVRYEAFPKLTREGFKQKPFYFLFMFLSLIVAAISNGKAIIFLLLIYIFYGLILSIIKSAQKILKPEINSERIRNV